ncbi:NADH:flavin oxidoreductase [Saccharothrix violaceirubra]|uniref:2,4-dienoyl-CoA reductase-like NADH-dependent reductase (Old Yellow Enzyme family) n=1 Tax=Saccharothrix violaceirubra TaxID=413306 RepID=A0A7W7WVM1_9PSEU|nr:NADH:flavin oxidoreductase [Saccharothrix violaceirubra]MBB4965465.1 2,4-dienoyl-CoA reductase-like NADH-dependent reductase (Old Yellow Enzyme family) [Saccharothrix violaceirubra]
MSRSEHAAPLFAPVDIGGLTVPNRVVMAPMTRASSPGGVPGPDVAEYYARRAAGGTGLIVTEGVVVDHAPNIVPDGIPRFHGEDALAGWRRVAEAVHRVGGLIFPQLWHLGAYDGPDAAPRGDVPAVGPSGLGVSGERVGEPMTEAEIAAAIGSFGRAASDARRIGFDGVELHGAHGFLIDQFLWDFTNRRTDAYGTRSRFAAEVVAEVRRVTAPDFPISLRLSQWKMGDYAARIAGTPEELADLLLPLVEAGVDVFHLSTRRFWLPEFAGSDLTLAGWTRKITGKPVVAVGSAGLAASDFESAFAGEGAAPEGVETIVAALERGDFDLIALGRALVSEPDWAAKVRTGRTAELKPFSPADLAALK